MLIQLHGLLSLMKEQASPYRRQILHRHVFTRNSSGKWCESLLTDIDASIHRWHYKYEEFRELPNIVCSVNENLQSRKLFIESLQSHRKRYQYQQTSFIKHLKKLHIFIPNFIKIYTSNKNLFVILIATANC